MIKQQIKEYFKDKKINYSGVNKFLKSNEKITIFFINSSLNL